MAILASRKTNYPYAVARVQAKRGKLIDRADYEKILRMDVSEITRFIEESQYKVEVDELSSRFGGLDLLEAALTVNEERTYAEVRRMMAGAGGDVLNAFLARYLVEDIKTVLRGKNAGASRDELLKELLLEDLDTYQIFQPLLADDIQSIAEVTEALARQGGLGASWARVLQRVPDGAALPAFEDALTKAYYARLLEAAEAFTHKGAAPFREFVRREIDARNLQNAARWVLNGSGYADGTPGDFTPYIIPGGLQFKVADVAALAECNDLADLADSLAAKDVAEAIVEAAREAADGAGGVSRLIHAVNQDLFAGLDRLAHSNPLSILPIVSFLLRKRDEVRTLRAVARGKDAGLSDERLREVLP